MNLSQYNRSPMPVDELTDMNPEMANQIAANPTFAALANELLHKREVQAMKYFYCYVLNDEIAGQVTSPFSIQIEQGTDFDCKFMTASVFSYDADNDTDFPIPNSIGVIPWAGRGLSAQITDSRSGRQLTSGFVPFELFATPGYGLNFQRVFPITYLFARNSRIRFDIRNRDNADRTHSFSIALWGYKIESPQ